MLRQAKFLEKFLGEKPLVSQVMDGVNRGRTVPFVFQQGRNQSCLPVVAVDDFRFPTKPHSVHGDLDTDPAQQRKALGIVRPRLAVFRQIRIA